MLFFFGVVLPRRSVATVNTAAKQGSGWQLSSGSQAGGICFKLIPPRLPSVQPTRRSPRPALHCSAPPHPINK